MRLRLTAAMLAAGLAFAGGASTFAATPASAPATAAPTARHLELTTALTAEHDEGPIVGKLSLTIATDGTVTGTYRGEDGVPQPVTGGLDGSKVWFDIGLRDIGPAQLSTAGRVGTPNHIHVGTFQQHLHVAGSLSNGIIVATTFIHDENYTFKAVPKKP